MRTFIQHHSAWINSPFCELLIPNVCQAPSLLLMLFSASLCDAAFFEFSAKAKAKKTNKRPNKKALRSNEPWAAKPEQSINPRRLAPRLFAAHLLQPSKIPVRFIQRLALRHPAARKKTSVMRPLIFMLTPTWFSSLILTRKRFSCWHESADSFGRFVSTWQLNLHQEEKVTPLVVLLSFSADSRCEVFLQRCFTPSVGEIV